MIIYSTLENVSNEVLSETNMKTASERLKKEVNLDKFCEMLREKEYDPTISVGAFDTDTGECVNNSMDSYFIVCGYSDNIYRTCIHE